MLPVGFTCCLCPGPSEEATCQVCCLLGGMECGLLKALGIWNLGASQGTGCHQEPGSVPWVFIGSSSKRPVSPMSWVGFCRKGLSSGVPGLWHRTESLPSLPALRDWTWICSVSGEPLDIVPCAQTEHPSIEAKPPNDQNAACLCPRLRHPVMPPIWGTHTGCVYSLFSTLLLLFHMMLVHTWNFCVHSLPSSILVVQSWELGSKFLFVVSNDYYSLTLIFFQKGEGRGCK